MAELMVMVREVGSVEYDIVYLTETVDGQPLAIEHLHALIKEALGKNETITKITLDEIAVRNTNGIRFMFKKSNPKLEVTFESSGGSNGGSSVPAHLANAMPSPGGFSPAVGGNMYTNAVVPVSPYKTAVAPASSGTNQWVSVLETNPFSFGHSGTTINDQLFVFGGFADEMTTSHALLLSDFSGNGKFSKLRVRGDIPPPRERHTAVLIGRRIYVFGGYNRGPDVYHQNIFVFESETLSWLKLEPRGTPPERRCGHSACVIDGKMWIFGGRVKARRGDGIFAENVVEYRNDLHCYDPATNEWLRYEPRGIGPSGRAMHTATAIGRKMYIFGGANSTGTRNDTSGFCDLYELDIDTMTWTECETQSTPPSPCYGHAAVYLGDDKILFFGGKGYSELSTIHTLELKTMTWRQWAFAGNKLAPRWGHCATLHEGKLVVVYGGRAAHGYYNTLEVIDASTQLIEMKPEEAAKEILKRKLEEKNKAREAMGNLQSAVHEISAMIAKFGEELIDQKRMIAAADAEILRLRGDSLTLRKRVAELCGDTLPPGSELGGPNSTGSATTTTTTTTTTSAPSTISLSSSNKSNGDEEYDYLPAQAQGNTDDEPRYTDRLDEDEVVNY